ncbi:MAG: polysaccharide deacetylase family protein [Roseobacter sp.]
MATNWLPLRRALAQFRAHDIGLPIWWRDDDAIAPSQGLDRLRNMAQKLALPAHIAVIPGLAQKNLPGAFDTSDDLVALVHGWRHENHAPSNAKKTEFSQHNDRAAGELKQAIQTMTRLFGQQFTPIFVPPWNRIDTALFNDLQLTGYAGLSTFTPRKSRLVAPGIVQINCHVDPIDWRGTRDLIDPDAIIAHTVSLLSERLRGETDNSEPLGYLTHHLVHTPDIWTFSEQFLTELLEGGATAQPLPPLLETPE